MTIDLKVRGTDGFTNKVITDAACSISLFAPPKNPLLNVGDRTADHVVAATYDPVSRYYIATVSTAGWPAGTWWFQGVVTGGAGGYNAWEYESFPLAA